MSMSELHIGMRDNNPRIKHESTAAREKGYHPAAIFICKQMDSEMVQSLIRMPENIFIYLRSVGIYFE
jgi:hypothetical protein